MPTTDMLPNKWVPDCPDCVSGDHIWRRCNVGKKSNPGWFALTGNNYKIYEECANCGICKLMVVRDEQAKYTYRRSLKNC